MAIHIGWVAGGQSGLYYDVYIWHVISGWYLSDLQIKDIQSGDLVSPHVAPLAPHRLIPSTAECFCPST